MDFSIIDENLTENNLRDMFKKVSAMPAGSEKCKLFYHHRRTIKYFHRINKRNNKHYFS